MVAKDDLSASARGMLKKVKRRYMESRDFNGLHVSTTRNTRDEIEAAVELATSGLIEVVGPSDYPNIHIRPWPSRRTVAEQIEELRELSDGVYGACLYPKAKALKGMKLPQKFEDAPFARAMARGKSTLELAFFSSDVLEGYRNDARYRFGMGDFGINFGLSEEAYDDKDQPKKDRVGLCTSASPTTCASTTRRFRSPR